MSHSIERFIDIIDILLELLSLRQVLYEMYYKCQPTG